MYSSFIIYLGSILLSPSFHRWIKLTIIEEVEQPQNHTARKWQILLLHILFFSITPYLSKITPFVAENITLPTKVHLVKAMVFPVVMYGCESWTIKKAECQSIDAFELWCWRRVLRVPWTARRSNKSILRRSVLGVHWKD